jgi:hypothetical protein
MMSPILSLLILSAAPFDNNAVPALPYIRPGTPAGPCACAVLGAAAAQPLMFATTTVPACVGWNTSVVIDTTDSAEVCFVATTTIAMEAYTTRNRAYITDTVSTSSGQGRCTNLPAAGKWTVWPSFEVMYKTGVGGYRSGICAGTAGASPAFSFGDARYPFCRVNGDCTEAGVSGGTCDTTADVTTPGAENTVYKRKRDRGCVFPVARSRTASTYLCVCPER